MGAAEGYPDPQTWNRHWRTGQSAVPLQAFNKLRSQSADETRGFVSSVFCPHRLEPKTVNGAVDAEMNHAPLGQTSLNYLRYGVPILVDPGELSSFFLVLVQLTGGVDVSCGRQSAQLGAGHASVLSPTEYTRMLWTGDADELIVRFDRLALERFLGSLIGQPIHKPLVFDLAMDCRTGTGAAWLRTVRFIQQELESANTLLTAPLAVKSFEQAVMGALLFSQRHNYSDALQTGLSPAAPRHVKLVEDYIDAHADEPISIEDLTAVSGVSARTLFTGFQRFRGTSPMKHLRDVRLERARQDLSQAMPGVTVTEIALKWGFSQLGRFAVEYKRQFAESPSETLRRALCGRA